MLDGVYQPADAVTYTCPTTSGAHGTKPITAIAWDRKHVATSHAAYGEVLMTGVMGFF
jgi:hypothetical protein